MERGLGQVRRARAWFPCVDNQASVCTFDISVTVRENEVAVAPGALTRTTLRPRDRRKTYQYRLAHRAPASQIVLAVGAPSMSCPRPLR